jgi:phage-related protein
MAALPLQNRISQQSKHSIAENVIAVGYGNGYEQRTVVGQNQQKDMWTITYNVVDDTDRATLLSFWRTHGNHLSFTWQAYGDTFVKKWLLSGNYSEQPLSGNHYKISFNIVQTYEL